MDASGAGFVSFALILTGDPLGINAAVGMNSLSAIFSICAFCYLAQAEVQHKTTGVTLKLGADLAWIFTAAEAATPIKSYRFAHAASPTRSHRSICVSPHAVRN